MSTQLYDSAALNCTPLEILISIHTKQPCEMTSRAFENQLCLTAVKQINSN